MASFATQAQVSAGGVVYRRYRRQLQIALISVGAPERWQLPKGLVGRGEAPEAAAQREVREEAGVETELIAPIDTISYWYFGARGGRRVRFHKQVHFFLFRYLRGDVADHDHEVNAARWVKLETAVEQLAFKNEQQVVARAREMLLEMKEKDPKSS
jgi:8-oxo-dGTP pyrophosphatase MutT (NUDIX family)